MTQFYMTLKGLMLCLLLASCSDVNRQFGLKDDNIAEELLEAALKFETGVDVDFTPDSKE